MRQELARRQSFTDAVMAFLKANPGRWIPATEFEAVGGRQAWRSRVAEARQVIEKEGGEVANRQWRLRGQVISEYRYTPQQPLGRDAATPIAQKRLFG